ncbi:MAG: tetratricopeptide repeat protein [Spirochaetales bacterium]|nr:tetratricopeptide repeat protein [Spirochaetales bacterium]
MKRSTKCPDRGYSNGRRALALHRDLEALRLLRAAVDELGPGDRLLSQRLYWLGIALLRLGRRDLAVKSLASAQKLAPRGHARSLYGRLVNGYGMAKSSCEDHDDFRAFYSVQAERYLGGRTAFRDEIEREAVSHALAGAWIGIVASGLLDDLDCAGKLQLYRKIDAGIPSVLAETRDSRAHVIPVDFRRDRRIGPADRCSCGSGLPWRLCCGRTVSPSEHPRG